MMLTGIGMMGYRLVVTQFTQSTHSFTTSLRRLCELSYIYHIINTYLVSTATAISVRDMR